MKKHIKLGEVELEEGYRAYYSKSDGTIRIKDDTGYAKMNMVRIMDHSQKMKNRIIDSFDGKIVFFVLEIAKSVNVE